MGTRLAKITLVAGLLGGCAQSSDLAAITFGATLTAVSPSRVSGTAAALSQGGRTRLTIEIRNGTPDTSYGWRMDTGTCSAPGQIVGGPALYPSLDVAANGAATADASVPGMLSRSEAHAVRVFQAVGGDEVVVACGDLAET